MHTMVNQKACIQCGLCPTICPAVFSLTPGEPAHAMEEEIPTEQEIAVQEAADNCPTSAIVVK